MGINIKVITLFYIAINKKQLRWSTKCKFAPTCYKKDIKINVHKSVEFQQA